MSPPEVLALAARLGPARGTLDPVPDDSQVGPGPFYLLLIGVLALVTLLLWLNMRKQLGKIDVPPRDARNSADPAEQQPEESPQDPTPDVDEDGPGPVEDHGAPPPEGRSRGDAGR